jgi:hypothetical protein
VIVRFSLVPWFCWGMFTGFWMITIIFCLNQDVQDLRINRMFDNGWVDEFLGMFDICFSVILLITLIT